MREFDKRSWQFFFGDHFLNSHFSVSFRKYSNLNWILFTMGNVDRDIGRHSGQCSGRYSVDTRSILGRQSVDTRSALGRQSVDIAVNRRSIVGRDTVDSRSRCVSADIAFPSSTLRRHFADTSPTLRRLFADTLPTLRR